MLKRTFRYLIAFIIMLHCLGVTQAISALSKDKGAFVSMLNVNEEETKKEKESKEDVDDMADFSCKPHLVSITAFFNGQQTYFTFSKQRPVKQFVIESPTPPPDFNC